MSTLPLARQFHDARALGIELKGSAYSVSLSL
jgi:hypothetical protein